MSVHAEDELKVLEQTLVTFRETLKEVNRLGGDGMVAVPTAPGTDAVPDAEALAGAEVVGTWSP